MSQEKTLQLPEVPFVNEMRLSTQNWIIAIGILVATLLITPRVWKRIERFETGRDYRIPYKLSKDYWLYERRIQQVNDPASIVVIGDSVVWGEYVLPDGTLTHFLNEESGQSERFVNGGVNGLFPLALDGLVKYYGKSLHHRKILLHCNVLWMSSPKADLQIEKEEKFNHAHLVPQFSPRIPCYRADANERLSAVVERNVSFMAWVNHLQSAYFGDKSIPIWTLQDDGNDPPDYLNSYRNPLREIKMAVPTAEQNDPERGPASPRHKPWTQNGGGPAQFDWVDLNTSFQWRAFKDLVRTLQERGNDVMVLVGPFNEHIIAKESQAKFQTLRTGIVAWFAENKIPNLVPEALASPLYADASHPLTQGYQSLAKWIYQNPGFSAWNR